MTCLHFVVEKEWLLMSDSSVLDIQDIFRQYNQLLTQGEEIEHVISLIDRAYGSEFRDIVNQYDSISDFAEQTDHDVTLMEKFCDCLPSGLVEERLLVFHYRSMLFGIDAATQLATTKLRSSQHYVTAVAAVAFILFFFSEFFIQPMMIGIFESFRTPAPEGWYLAHGITLFLIPVVISWLLFTRWLLGRSGEINRYFLIATMGRRFPILGEVGDAFRSYVITSFVRYAGSLKLDRAVSVDTVRQAVAITYNDSPHGANLKMLERIIRNLNTAANLDIFTQELGFWENQAKETVEGNITGLATTLESSHMVILGAFVGAMIIQIYLWIFSMGVAFG
jgi:hypothetical protein